MEPDLVIVAYVLNDPDTEDGGLAEHYETRSELFHWMRGWFSEPVADGPAHASGALTEQEYHYRIHRVHHRRVEAAFERFASFQQSTGTPVVVAIVPLFLFEPGYPYLWTPLNRTLQELARRHGLTCLDLFDMVPFTDAAEVSLDPWHPNVAGHEMIARALHDWLVGNSDQMTGPSERDP